MNFTNYYIIKGIDELNNFNNLKNNTKKELPIIFVNNFNNIDENNDYLIIQTTINDIITYYKNEKYIFNIDNLFLNLNIFENKSIFAKFMIEFFKDNFPFCYYYQYDNVNYINDNIDENVKKIQKNNNEFAGRKIKIIYKIDTTLKNTVITKYHQHYFFYTAHFLVKNGIILKKIYFKSNNNNDNNYIQRGSITDYEILENIECNDSIFTNIFSKLNYSGFSHSDFIVENNKVIIFEINSRMGGSLTNNSKVLNDFLEILIKNF